MSESGESPAAPQRLGGFELISKIAEGGMGAVFKARQVSLDRTVAVKILPERLARDGQFVSRFLREAKLAARFSHPNIVGAVDAGEADGIHYFAMEYVEGESLGELLRREGVLPEARAVEITTQIARALDCAHKHDMVHRDVKPDNVLMDAEGTAKLVDLGLARQVSDEATQLTQAGTAMGSPHYIAPEQARGEPDIDIRADIYALGGTFYHLVTGATAFTGQTAAVIMTKHLNEAPTPAHELRPSVSEAASRVIAKMMAKDRDERYATPADLLVDLERLARGQQPAAAPVVRPHVPDPAVPYSTDVTFLMSEEDIRARRRRNSLMVPVLVVACLAIAAGAAVLFLAPWKVGEEEKALVRIEALMGAGKLDEAKGALDALLAKGPPGEKAKALKEALDRALRERKAKGLAKAAAAELAAVEGLIAEGRLDVEKLREAFRRARAGAVEFPGKREAFEELASRASRLLDDREKAAELEAEFKAACAKAEALMARQAYDGAAEAFSKALGLKDDPEVKARRVDALFLAEKTRGETAEAAGDLAGAIASYEKALAIKADPGLASHVAKLRREALAAEALAKRLARADELERKGDFDGALGELRAALEAAPRAKKEDLRRRMEALSAKDKAYREAVDGARAHLEDCRLEKCIALATGALEFKPGDAEASRLAAEAKGRMVIRNSAGVELVYLPGGEFTMGSDSGDRDERPPHRVRLSHFYISRTEVTNEQFERFRAGHVSQRKYSEADDCPVVRVSWRDATAFCEWLGAEEGVLYSLPTEAQWEYAATGTGAGTPYPWGGAPPSATLCNIGWGAQEKWASDGHEYAAPVGSFAKGAGPRGLVDLVGNVWEWCLDWYAAGEYRTEAARRDDPTGPTAGREKVLRGGSFIDPPEKCRSRYRSKKNPAAKAANFGFRIVREAR